MLRSSGEGVGRGNCCQNQITALAFVVCVIYVAYKKYYKSNYYILDITYTYAYIYITLLNAKEEVVSERYTRCIHIHMHYRFDR